MYEDMGTVTNLLKSRSILETFDEDLLAVVWKRGGTNYEPKADDSDICWNT